MSLIYLNNSILCCVFVWAISMIFNTQMIYKTARNILFCFSSRWELRILLLAWACLHSPKLWYIIWIPVRAISFFGIVNVTVRLLSVRSRFLWNVSYPCLSWLPNQLISVFAFWYFLDKYLYLLHHSLMILYVLNVCFNWDCECMTGFFKMSLSCFQMDLIKKSTKLLHKRIGTAFGVLACTQNMILKVRNAHLSIPMITVYLIWPLFVHWEWKTGQTWGPFRYFLRLSMRF